MGTWTGWGTRMIHRCLNVLSTLGTRYSIPVASWLKAVGQVELITMYIDTWQNINAIDKQIFEKREKIAGL